MRALARVGDRTQGICICHRHPIAVGGTIKSGAADVETEGQANARIGDIVEADCGHTGIIVSGSGIVEIEGSGAAHIDDVFVGCYTGRIIEGATDVEGN